MRTRGVVLDLVSLALDDVLPVRVMIRADGGVDIVYRAEDEDAGPVFLYGAVSDKIGEAAVCWICRWGVDILPYEELAVSSSDSLDTSPASPVPGPSNLGHKHTTSYDSRLSAAVSAGDVPRLWRRGGLTARWIRAILSSNSFFVKDEKQRYEVSRSIVELRRREGVNAKEEQEWEQFFAKGIHYMHMVSSYIFS